MGNSGIGGIIRSADQGGACAGIDSFSVPSSCSKLQYRPAAGSFTDPRRFRRDEYGVIQLIEQRRFKYLRHGERALHNSDRFMGMYNPAFRNSLQGNTGKNTMRPKPCNKIIVEESLAGPPGLTAKILEVFLTKPDIEHPVQKPLKPGVDTITSLVSTVIRAFAKEVIKLGRAIMQSHPEI